MSLAIATIEIAPTRAHLYSPSECRANLYAVLHSLVASPHHLCPPPVQYAASIFSIAQISDPNHGVREACATYLRAIEKILHPQKETLQFPADANEVADAFKERFGVKGLSDDEDSEEEVSVTVEPGVVVVRISLCEIFFRINT